MKAIVYTKYGTANELQLKEVGQPIPKDHEVLIRVMAVSLNASDVEFLRGEPIYVRMWGFSKPKYPILGSDIAGIIEAVGENVSNFKIGDEVLGDIMYRWGGLAEYICVPATALVLKPKNMPFTEAAAMPQAGVVALQALRDKGHIEAGQKVLINGAGGGAGTFAIQLAKHFGAEVTGIDNGSKLGLMLSVGADHVIDYTKENFAKGGEQYDLIIDFVAYRSIFDHKKVLKPNGRYVLVGGSIACILQTLFIGGLISFVSNKKMGILGHEQKVEDLATLLKLYESGTLLPVIDKTFTLEDTHLAFEQLGKGQIKGKVVVSLESNKK